MVGNDERLNGFLKNELYVFIPEDIERAEAVFQDIFGEELLKHADKIHGNYLICGGIFNKGVFCEFYRILKGTYPENVGFNFPIADYETGLIFPHRYQFELNICPKIHGDIKNIICGKHYMNTATELFFDYQEKEEW